MKCKHELQHHSDRHLYIIELWLEAFSFNWLFSAGPWITRGQFNLILSIFSIFILFLSIYQIQVNALLLGLIVFPWSLWIFYQCCSQILSSSVWLMLVQAIMSKCCSQQWQLSPVFAVSIVQSYLSLQKCTLHCIIPSLFASSRNRRREKLAIAQNWSFRFKLIQAKYWVYIIQTK